MAYTLPFPNLGAGAPPPVASPGSAPTSSPFSLSSLLANTAAPLGGKILGDQLAPEGSLMNAQTNQGNAAFGQSIALNQLARQNQVNSVRLPGMYATLGYSPDQANAMTAKYSSVPTPPQTVTGGSGGSSGGGSSVGKTVLGAGLSLAPAIPGIIGALGHGGAAAAGAEGTAVGLSPLAATGIGAAVAGAGILGTYLWKKSQVHPTADKWVQGEQNPFDQSMANLDKSGLPPDQLKAAKQQNAQNYLTELQKFSQQGGHENIVARQAAQTFRQYYGDPSQYGVNLGV